MRRKEADRLKHIADELDSHAFDIYNKDQKQARWFQWASQEIRKVLFSSGFHPFFDAEYDILTGEWIPYKEDE